MDNRKSFVNVRGGFSDTSGVAPCNTEMQLHEFDKRTRILLSNKTFKFLNIAFGNQRDVFSKWNVDSAFCEDILSKVFLETTRFSNGQLYNWEEVFKKSLI